MKLQVKILAVLILVAGISTASMATDPKKKDVAIKILPSGKAGLVKLLYVNPDEKAAVVTLHSANGVIFTETVRSSRFNKGFIKLYDVSMLKSGTYWLEVQDSELSVKYELALKDGNMWVNYWNNYLPSSVVAMKK